MELRGLCGGGAVGLALAREISPNWIIVGEQNTMIGSETSSRNSEVIHWFILQDRQLKAFAVLKVNCTIS